MLVEVFAKRLGLSKEDVIRPENPETIIALGAACSLESLFADDKRTFRLANWQMLWKNCDRSECRAGDQGTPFLFFAGGERRIF